MTAVVIKAQKEEIYVYLRRSMRLTHSLIMAISLADPTVSLDVQISAGKA